MPGVVYDFCIGRGAQYPTAFLGSDGKAPDRWRGTLVRDEYKAYDSWVFRSIVTGDSGLS